MLAFDEIIRNFTGNAISAFLVLDRDYRCDGDVSSIVDQLQQRNVRCHVWRRKELENYLLVPGAISRSIRGAQRISETQVNELLRAAADEFLDDVISQRVFEEQQYARATSSGEHPTSVSNRVMRDVRERWDQEWTKLAPGKQLLARLRERMQEQGIRPPTDGAIVSAMAPSDIPHELTDLFDAVVRTATTPYHR